MTDKQKLAAEAEAQRIRDEADAKEKADAAAAAAAAEAAAKAAEGDFVKMVKLGHEPTLVHPTCVQSHVNVGWQVVQ